MFKVVYLKDKVNVDYKLFDSFKQAIEFALTLEEKQILEIKKYDNYVSDV